MEGIITNNQFIKQLKINRFVEMGDNFEFEICKKLVYWGVRSLGYKGKVKFLSDEDRLFLYRFVSGMIDEITPRQLMSIFPITKIYDGDKYEMKDYFYAMKKCEEHGLDKKIGNSFEFLWDYLNKHTGIFVVNYLSTLSDVYKSETGQGLAETYFAEAGITTYSEKTINGNSVMVENLKFNNRGELI